jgi:hypothetical protein
MPAFTGVVSPFSGFCTPSACNSFPVCKDTHFILYKYCANIIIDYFYYAVSIFSFFEWRYLLVNGPFWDMPVLLDIVIWACFV